jgi:hypothetical protein
MISSLQSILVGALVLVACDSPAPREESNKLNAQAGHRKQGNLKMRFDYSGAEAMLAMLQRPAVTKTAIDSLLAIKTVRSTLIENPARFIPNVKEDVLRADIEHFVRTKEPISFEADNPFQLGDTWKNRKSIREMISRLRATENSVVPATLQPLHRYSPDTMPLTVDIYFVAGGVSDGFVFDTLNTNVYINLARANGDYHGILSNIAHETYHVIQKEAQRRVAGLRVVADSTDTLPVGERLLARTLTEGTAFFVTDPTRTDERGRNMDKARSRFRKNQKSKQVARNFALFDSILREMLEGRAPWSKAEMEGFSNEAPFYFVGYEMAKAIDRYCGAECIKRAFVQQPVEFFRQYVALYRMHPDIIGRFSPETEAFIEKSRQVTATTP